jgi:GT2 family glycosyltransferase
MSDRPLVAAVIVNFNAGEELRACLASLAADLAQIPWEAVVVDNASSDDSGDIAAAFAPQARLIRNAANVGFGRGINQGIAATTASLVLIVNPDCRLSAGATQQMRAALASHPQCALVGPRVLDPSGADQGSARGDPDMLTGLFGRRSTLRRLFPRLAVSKRNVLDEPVSDGDSRVVDWVSGACMLARRHALEQVGGFDERFFLYWEDADLCRRLRSRGFEIRYVPSATAVHRVGHSSRTAHAASVRAFHESAYRYYATHVAPGALNPKRWVARFILGARCWWKLRAESGGGGSRGRGEER